MKLVRYTVKEVGSPRIGLMTEAYMVDLSKAYASYLEEKGEAVGKEGESTIADSVTEFLAKGKSATKLAQEVLNFVKGREKEMLGGAVLETGDVKLLAPIEDPPKILGLAGNYISHVREVRKDRPLPRDIFIFYKSSGPGIVGPDEPIVVPKSIEKLDYELELGVVIGKRGRYVPVEKAYDHVGGYTVFNDVCDRYFLVDVPRWDWFGMKAQDSMSVFGPCIETNIDDPNNLKMTLKVNDELRQDGHTSDMINPVPHVVSFVSSLSLSKLVT